MVESSWMPDASCIQGRTLTLHLLHLAFIASLSQLTQLSSFRTVAESALHGLSPAMELSIWGYRQKDARDSGQRTAQQDEFRSD